MGFREGGGLEGVGLWKGEVVGGNTIVPVVPPELGRRFVVAAGLAGLLNPKSSLAVFIVVYTSYAVKPDVSDETQENEDIVLKKGQ